MADEQIDAYESCNNLLIISKNTGLNKIAYPFIKIQCENNDNLGQINQITNYYFKCDSLNLEKGWKNQKKRG